MQKTKRETVTENERLQLAGLIALGQRYCTLLRDVESAALAITQELQSDGTLCNANDGSRTGDALYSFDENVDTLLRELGLRVESSVIQLKTSALVWKSSDKNNDIIGYPHGDKTGIRYEIKKKEYGGPVVDALFAGQLFDPLDDNGAVLVTDWSSEIADIKQECEEHFSETQKEAVAREKNTGLLLWEQDDRGWYANCGSLGRHYQIDGKSKFRSLDSPLVHRGVYYKNSDVKGGLYLGDWRDTVEEAKADCEAHRAEILVRRP